MKTHQLDYKGAKIAYTSKGEGKGVLLLHGYLESKEIWAEFADILALQFNVIAIDLPGHGQSGIPNGGCTMENMAGAVNAVVENTKTAKYFVIGHSMGGYATMAFVELFPEKVNAFSLFHSSPFADKDEKKQNRNREIGLVQKGKKEQLYPLHFPKTFANDNVTTFNNAIESAIKTASTISEENIVSVIEGMRDRKDRSDILHKSELPFLYVLGKKDNFIPEEILNIIKFPKETEHLILSESGHMGFIEETQKAAEAIIRFYNKMVYGNS